MKKEDLRKTRIVCTIGPASESEEMLTKLVKAGMNVARINFSHGGYEENAEKIATIKKKITKSIKRTNRGIYGIIRYLYIIWRNHWKNNGKRRQNNTT